MNVHKLIRVDNFKNIKKKLNSENKVAYDTIADLQTSILESSISKMQTKFESHFSKTQSDLAEEEVN